MLSIFFITLVMVILSEGVGQWFLKLIGADRDGFAAPVGTSILFTLLEIVYLPVMLHRGNMHSIAVLTVIVIGIALIILGRAFIETYYSLVRPRMIYVLFSALLLMGLFAVCATRLDPSNNAELVQMIGNAHASSIDLTGARLQGYSLFGSCAVLLFGESPIATAIALSVYANMITVMLLLNIIDSFQIENPWFRFTLILGSVFYYQFYSWKIISAFQGGNWRLVFAALSLFALYQWLKTGNDRNKFIYIAAMGAGFFAHKGFFMIAVEILYCLACWLFYHRKIRALFDVSTFFIPIVVYFSAWLSLSKPMAGLLLFGIYILFCLLRHRKKVYRRMINLENYLIDHSRGLFYIAIPLIFLVGTFILRFFVDGYGFEYSEYISFFSASSLKSYLFMSGSFIDFILDIWRWAGLFFFLVKAETDEEKMIRNLFLGMAVFFVNPLCMGMLSEITGIETYAYAFEILFNPFTDVLIFYWIYKQFEWTVAGQWLLELCLVFAVIFGHASSFANKSSGLYSDLIEYDAQTGEVIIP